MMRVINYSATEQLAECRIQRGTIIDEIEVREIDFRMEWNLYNEDYDIVDLKFKSFKLEDDTFVPITLTSSQLHDLGRGILEYIDTDNELDEDIYRDR